MKWNVDGAGVVFGKDGVLMSAHPFHLGSKGYTPCSFEIWLEPARVDKMGTILAYYRPEHPSTQILLRQFKSNLILARGDLNYQRRRPLIGIHAADVFRKQEPVLLSITTGGEGTALYADGVLVQRSTGFKFSSDDLSGQLIFGSAPGSVDAWSGILKSYAVFDRELSADEVRQHYASWRRGDGKALGTLSGALALYSFCENHGTVAHNQVDSTTDLVIPCRFFVPDKRFLEAPWSEFHPSWSYWKSDIINLVGFIPFGFVFYALFDSESHIGRPMCAAIALGFVVSLTIEVLQGFLPTRSSGTTDLFTNTLGTALGAIIYMRPSVRCYIGKVARYAGVREETTK